MKAIYAEGHNFSNIYKCPSDIPKTIRSSRMSLSINGIVLAAASRSEEGQELACLYLQKFFAVCNERYEDAQKLQDRINEAKSGT